MSISRKTLKEMLFVLVFIREMKFLFALRRLLLVLNFKLPFKESTV
jgi:hypothetical protein